MKRVSLLRLFSWLVVIAVVVTMAPPALSSDAYVNQEGRGNIMAFWLEQR